MEYKKIGFSEADIDEIQSELADSQLTIKVVLKSGEVLSTAPITLSAKDTKPTSVSTTVSNNKLTVTIVLSDGTRISSLPLEYDTKPTAISTDYADGSLTTKITLSNGNVLQDSVIIDQNHYVESTESLTEATTWVSGGVLTEFAEQVYQGIAEAALKNGVVVINGSQHTIIVSDFTASNENGDSPYQDISFIVGRKLCVLQWSFVTDTGEWTPTFSALEHNSFTVTENDDGTVDLTIE